MGGNALFMNGYVRWCNLSRNEVRYPGDSAFAAVGRTAKFDATGGDYPQDNTVEWNHLHELVRRTIAGLHSSKSASNDRADRGCIRSRRRGTSSRRARTTTCAATSSTTDRVRVSLSPNLRTHVLHTLTRKSAARLGCQLE